MIQDLSSSLPLDSLLSYGPEPASTFGRAGDMAGRILKGAKASEIPIEQPHRYELVVNRKLARSQGLGFSEIFLMRATRIID
jgi:putative ABC transport system substrate-binding protein